MAKLTQTDPNNQTEKRNLLLVLLFAFLNFVM